MPWLIHHLLTQASAPHRSHRSGSYRRRVPRGVGIQSRAETEARRRTALLASPAPALVASTGSTIVVELSEDPEGQLYALRCLEGLEGKDFEGHFPSSDTRSGRCTDTLEVQQSQGQPPSKVVFLVGSLPIHKQRLTFLSRELQS